MTVNQSDAASPAAKVKLIPPAPLCTFKQNKGRWTSNLLLNLLWVVIGAYIGTHIVVSVYYLVFEAYPPITHGWHQLVPDSNFRHAIRNVGEGLLGGLLAKQLVWNHYKRNKPLTKFEHDWLRISDVNDNLEVRWNRLLRTPLQTLIFGIPGFLATFGIVLLVQHFAEWVILSVQNHLDEATSGIPVVNEAQSTWIDNWDQKLMGYAAAFFFAVRPAKGEFDNLQELCALRRLTRERTGQYMLWQRLPVLGWLWRHLPKVLPRSYEARLNDLRQQTDITLELGDNRVFTAVMSLVTIIGLGLAAHGWYVLKYIAGT